MKKEHLVLGVMAVLVVAFGCGKRNSNRSGEFSAADACMMSVRNLQTQQTQPAVCLQLPSQVDGRSLDDLPDSLKREICEQFVGQYRVDQHSQAESAVTLSVRLQQGCNVENSVGYCLDDTGSVRLFYFASPGREANAREIFERGCLSGGGQWIPLNRNGS